MPQSVTPAHPGASIFEKMDWDRYLDWCSKENDAEWVDGELVWMLPVSLKSGDVTSFLSILVHQYVEHHNLGRVFGSRVLMRLAARPSARMPDIFFVAKERLALVMSYYVDGPADLAVEVTAEETEERDRVAKFQEYERAGVREYWIIDPDNRRADFYQLGTDGRYALIRPDENGIYISMALNGLWLKVAWFWQSPRPTIMSVLREWKLV